MKIRVAYHENKEAQQFNELVEHLKPKIKSVKHLKNTSNTGYNVAFIILRNPEKATK